jgi:hypothetical protein
MTNTIGVLLVSLSNSIGVLVNLSNYENFATYTQPFTKAMSLVFHQAPDAPVASISLIIISVYLVPY